MLLVGERFVIEEDKCQTHVYNFEDFGNATMQCNAKQDIKNFFCSHPISSAFVLSNAMGGGIFFKEFNKLNERGVNMYMCGVSFVIFGVLSMAYIKHKEIEEQAANTKKEKDVIDLTDEVEDEELTKGIKKTKRSKSKGRTTPKSSSKKKTKKSLNTRGSSPELKISK